MREGDAESLVCPWLHFEYAPPVQLGAHGEDLMMVSDVPYTSCDMGQYGELRVGPAQPPDLLAAAVGQHLQASAVLASPWTSDGRVGAIVLEFSAARLLIGAAGDEWVLVNDPAPGYLATHWNRNAC